MTTAMLTRKIERVEQRLRKVEYQLGKPRASHADIRAGLELLHGMWAEHPRSARDLTTVRKKIWRTRE